MNNTLKYGEYLGSVEYSSEDNCLYGKILGINDLVTFEGYSIAELNKAFQEAVDDYLNICKRNSREPEKSYQSPFSLCINPTLYRQADLDAAAHGVTLNRFLEQAIEEYVHRKSFYTHS